MSEPDRAHKKNRRVTPNTNKRDKVWDQNHGYNLGRDHPLWPQYLEEAEKFDDMMIQKWDRKRKSKMETLLLFATLFSAIVTAFVIESSQGLQPDNAAITSTAVVEIVGILQNRTLDSSSIFGSPDKFQPSTNAFIVNFVWFISLCLSITVALLAGLVKQWCNTLLSDRTAPPCNQARIRQARLNGLVRWRTKLVIFALPVVMDVALGLFLLGLLVFLWDLNHVIFLASLSVTFITAVFYFSTTLAPCFFSFCPYETAITSRKAWGLFYKLCLATMLWIGKHFRDVDLTNYMSPEEKERHMANKTDPDELTGDALRWIILHSQNPEPREMAICAIATLDSQEALKQLVLDPMKILLQVVQSFTSCFVVKSMRNGAIGPELGFKNSINCDEASLYGRALTVIVTQILLSNNLEHEQENDINDVELGLVLSKWAIEPITKQEVKTRFEYLANTESTEAKTWALVGLSAWYDFMGVADPRFNQGDTVRKLANSLDNFDQLAPILRKEVLRALTKEITYWAPNVSNNCQRETLRSLINLVPSIHPAELPYLACALVVLALNLNHDTSYPLLRARGSQSEASSEGESGNRLAKRLMRHYVGANGRGKLAKDGHSLLFFALTGLMEYCEHCDFNDRAHKNMTIIAKRIQEISSLGKLQSLVIPRDSNNQESKDILIDLRTYFINTLSTYLRIPRTVQNSHDLEGVIIYLLKAISPTRQSCELKEYGPRIMPLVTQTLVQTENINLQIECLSAIISYWDPGLSLLYTRMQLFYEVLPKLLQIIRPRNKSQQLWTIHVPKISIIFQKMGEQADHFTADDHEMLASCMDSIMREGLLRIVVNSVHISERPEFLTIESKSNATAPLLEKVRAYLQGRNKENGELLLDKMIEAYRHSPRKVDRDREIATGVLQHWRNYHRQSDSNNAMAENHHQTSPTSKLSDPSPKDPQLPITRFRWKLMAETLGVILIILCDLINAYMLRSYD